jgi:hypothetical protein
LSLSSLFLSLSLSRARRARASRASQIANEPRAAARSPRGRGLELRFIWRTYDGQRSSASRAAHRHRNQGVIPRSSAAAVTSSGNMALFSAAPPGKRALPPRPVARLSARLRRAAPPPPVGETATSPRCAPPQTPTPAPPRHLSCLVLSLVYPRTQSSGGAPVWRSTPGTRRAHAALPPLLPPPPLVVSSHAAPLRAVPRHRRPPHSRLLSKRASERARARAVSMAVSARV